MRFKELVLRRAATADVSSGRVTRAQGHIVIVMRHYPRFIAKERRDEYVPELAPEPALFKEFKQEDRRLGRHDDAFAKVDYERRFWIAAAGRAELARMAGLSRQKDVYLICQCGADERCHGDLLLLMARALHGAEISPPTRDYPVFAARLAAWTADF